MDTCNLTIVVGGQAGSEGKGAITAALCAEAEYDLVVRIGGPNAGHTVVVEDGQRFAFRQLPVAAVADGDSALVIAAGSEVDPDILEEEIVKAENAGFEVRDRLYVDRMATLLEPEYVSKEADILTGTTGKGIGGARAARALRQAKLLESSGVCDIRVMDTQEMVRESLRAGDRVLIEGTQGYQLGSHAGYYPYCTSGDCKASDFLAAVGLPPQEAEIWVVLRTYPIRIAGNSGPLLHETTWEEIGVEPEITTVTKKVRRVGLWNWDWAQDAIEANAPPGRRVKVALTFADYWWPEIKGLTGSLGRVDDGDLYHQVKDFVDAFESALPEAEIAMLGTGPNTQLLVQKGE